MAYEVFDGTDMVRQLFGEGQGVTDEAGNALPHRVIKALEMIGFPGVLRDGFVLRRRNDPCVDGILIGIERRLLTLHRRKIGPQLFRALVTAVPDVEGNDLPCLLVHSAPHPLLVGLLLHKALHLIGFHLKTPDEHIPWGYYRLHIQMIRQGLKASD